MLVTGANKGIGLSIAKGALAAGCHVFLGSRDVGRGEAAAAALVEGDAGAEGRVTVVQLDVCDRASVAAAVTAVAAKTDSLYALVNNAGGGAGMSYIDRATLDSTLALNLFSVQSVCSAFLPLLLAGGGGRIVMVGSGAGPSFVEKCDESHRATLNSPAITWEDIAGFCGEAYRVAVAVDAGGLDAKATHAAAGLGDGGSYGLSKALLTSVGIVTPSHPLQAHQRRIPVPGHTHPCRLRGAARAVRDAAGPRESQPHLLQLLSRLHRDRPHPALRHRHGQDPCHDMGMKAPDDGAVCPLFLTLGDVPSPSGSAWFFGSDAKRSPLDREPGDPPYDGGESVASASGMGV